jgi:hypothetical protein
MIRMHMQSGAGTANNDGCPARHYTLSLLAVIHAFKYPGCNILSIVLQSTKKELLLSDTAPGPLRRMAFAAFYTTLVLPAAWFANSYRRSNIITTGLEVQFEGGKVWN